MTFAQATFEFWKDHDCQITLVNGKSIFGILTGAGADYLKIKRLGDHVEIINAQHIVRVIPGMKEVQERSESMKRTQEWWARLTRDERSELYWLERAKGGGTSYLPENCGECGCCSTPFLGSGDLCNHCLNTLIKLIDKADGKAVKQ